MKPEFIYKYFKINDNFYDFLLNDRLYFSNPYSFNDPFDCKILDQTHWDSDSIRTYCINNNLNDDKFIDGLAGFWSSPEKLRKHINDFVQEVVSGFGVCCFTADPLNILMWSHYGDSHNGVCVKINTTDEAFFRETHFVNYSKEYPILLYKNLTKFPLYETLLTKAEIWQYEKEVRVLKWQNGLFPIDKNCLSEIMLGVKTDQKEVEKIKKIISKKNIIVDFSQLRVDETEFRLNRL
jgi:Protein of unknown function (DUF2971)